MRKDISIFLAAIIFVPLFTPHVYASSITNVVNISNSTGNSSNTIIHNSVQSSSTTSVSSTFHTSIHIDNNGIVKDYESDQPGDVTIQSDTGNTQVHVNNSTGNTSTNVAPMITINQSNEITKTQKFIDEATKSAHHTVEILKKKLPEQFNFFQFIQSIFSFRWL